jgi:hypothetical protein
VKKAKKIGRPEKWTPDKLNVLAEELLSWFANPGNLWLKDFATMKGLYWGSLTDFAEKSESFSHALKIAKEMQESKLVKIGLSKRSNVAMAIFALKNVSGWRDVTETDLRTKVQFDPVVSDPYKELVELHRLYGNELEAILAASGIAIRKAAAAGRAKPSNGNGSRPKSPAAASDN